MSNGGWDMVKKYMALLLVIGAAQSSECSESDEEYSLLWPQRAMTARELCGKFLRFCAQLCSNDDDSLSEHSAIGMESDNEDRGTYRPPVMTLPDARMNDCMKYDLDKGILVNAEDAPGQKVTDSFAAKIDFGPSMRETVADRDKGILVTRETMSSPKVRFSEALDVHKVNEAQKDGDL